MTASKRDANEEALIELWRGCGCVVIQMDRKVGFDLIVICPHTGIYLVEVKDGTKRWTLTEREWLRCNEITLANGTYSIVTNEKEALELVGQ